MPPLLRALVWSVTVGVLATNATAQNEYDFAIKPEFLQRGLADDLIILPTIRVRIDARSDRAVAGELTGRWSTFGNRITTDSDGVNDTHRND